MFHKSDLKVYFICGSQDIPDGVTIHEVVREALEAGITMFQFREKGPGARVGDEKALLATELFKLCKEYHVPFIVNDDVTLAKQINADGIHLGQDDVAISDVASQFKDKIIGLSVGNVEEYHNSDLTNVDYIGVGPMYATRSKDDSNHPVGPEMIPTLRQYVNDLPIVAIGGIDVNNANEIVEAGADGLSVISVIAKSENISETVQHLLQSVEQ